MTRLPVPPPAARFRHPLLRTRAGAIGLAVLAFMLAACVLSLPWTATSVVAGGAPRYEHQERATPRMPPVWWPLNAAQKAELAAAGVARPWALLGTDVLGRDLLARCLFGGAISLGIGVAAAAVSVLLGTLYGAIAGFIGGRVDNLMMRAVDVLYGLPYILLVVLLAVAVDGVLERWQAARIQSAGARVESRVIELAASLSDTQKREPGRLTALRGQARAEIGSGELSAGQVQAVNILTMVAAIGGVSWLTMARVVRGQVLSLKAQPFMEAARAIGVPRRRQFSRHLLPNLVGPIVVYATLTVPQAILQESFLSFLGIGVRPPVPSWGNLAAEGLAELNTVQSNWWMLVFPCLLLASTLLALNFVGESLRDAIDPKRVGGRA
ncbi:MAG: ABC transporter permease [Phycisphaerales bacterium]